jgi:hypothetical protein
MDYKIQYRKGIENSAVDALSRKPACSDATVADSSCCAISCAQPTWLQEVLVSYDTDSSTQRLLTKLAMDNSAIPDFSLHNGILRYKGSVWVGANQTLQHKLLSAFHSLALGGHSGVPVTYRMLKQLFAWQGMKSAVHTFVQSCLTCQQAKPDRGKSPGILQPLPVPEGAWQMVTLDFVEGLPRSGHANCILVVVDKFTKYRHFLPLLHPFTTAGVVKIFLDNVYKLHGMPLSIVTDRDRIFTSKFRQELFQLAGVQLRMSSSYHPQFDRQTGRVNQCMETFLRCFVSSCPKQWIKWISVAEFWYNTSLYSAIGMFPFEALYGHPPRVFGLPTSVDCAVSNLSEWLQNRQLITELVKHLNREVLRMKHQADKGHSERQFSVGDLVFLKLQPYVQSSLASRANQKLSYKFFRPFVVLEKVGSVVYKLDLPSSSAIHPVFHVSQLKKVIGKDVQVSASLPSELSQFQYPELVLQRRIVQRGVRQVVQVPFKWSSSPAALATWEDMEALQQKFPEAPAWGQAGSKGGESVSTVVAKLGRQDMGSFEQTGCPLGP